ncbi:MAG: Flagellin protein FlaA, partial [uncultured Solirubrobacteraceae bacterium]
MGLRIQNNVEAFNAHRNLGATAGKAAKAMEKLSSGYRINRAADDAAGLAISEKMRGQIGGLAQAQRNAQDAISLVQTGEGALSTVSAMVQRIRDLKVQYETGTLSTSDKTALDAEFTQLKTEVTSIRDNTEFNGIDLLSATGAVSFQVGANQGETITANTVDLNGASGMGTALGAATSLAGVSLNDVDAAVGNIAKLRSDFGAVQNRLEHRLNNLSVYQENLVASESRIRDVDMAAEMVNFSKLQILQQAGTSMLAQA